MEELIRNIRAQEAVVLKDLIEYEKGSVSSLTLAQRPGVGITLMAFSSGEEISTHAAPGDALVTVLEGEGEFTIAGIPHVLKQGESIVMPKDIPHAVRAVSDFKMLLVLVK